MKSSSASTRIGVKRLRRHPASGGAGVPGGDGSPGRGRGSREPATSGRAHEHSRPDPCPGRRADPGDGASTPRGGDARPGRAPSHDPGPGRDRQDRGGPRGEPPRTRWTAPGAARAVPAWDGAAARNTGTARAGGDLAGGRLARRSDPRHPTAGRGVRSSGIPPAPRALRNDRRRCGLPGTQARARHPAQLYRCPATGIPVAADPRHRVQVGRADAAACTEHLWPGGSANRRSWLDSSSSTRAFRTKVACHSPISTSTGWTSTWATRSVSRRRWSGSSRRNSRPVAPSQASTHQGRSRATTGRGRLRDGYRVGHRLRQGAARRPARAHGQCPRSAPVRRDPRHLRGRAAPWRRPGHSRCGACSAVCRSDTRSSGS